MKIPTGMRALRAQALKAAILNFMDFADQAIPEDDCCMCGDKQDNHTFDSGHAFTAATQYHSFTLRKEVEKYLDVLETDEATTVTHSDLHGNESQVAVIGPSSFPMCAGGLCCNKQAQLYAQATGADVYADGKLIAREHVLWKDGDLFVPDHLKDRNGQVALRECKVCGAAEAELFEHPVCPGEGKKVYRHG